MLLTYVLPKVLRFRMLQSGNYQVFIRKILNKGKLEQFIFRSVMAIALYSMKRTVLLYSMNPDTLRDQDES